MVLSKEVEVAIHRMDPGAQVEDHHNPIETHNQEPINKLQGNHTTVWEIWPVLIANAGLM